VTGFKHNGTYIATLMVEDFPVTRISVGAATKTPSDYLSQIPLQVMNGVLAVNEDE